MKTKSSVILFGLIVALIWATAVHAAPPMSRQRDNRHPSPHAQKGMRHYVAEQGVTYTYINGVLQPVPCAPPPPPPVVVQQPVYVAAPVVIPAPAPVVVQTYETRYAPPPPNPPACFLYTPWVQPGISISLSF